MNKIKTNNGDILVVNVLPEHHEFKISGSNYLCSRSDKFVYEQLDGVCEILGKLSELIDEDCDDFVEIKSKHPTKNVYKDYTDYSNGRHVCMVRFIYSAKESFISLLNSNGIDTSIEDNLLIIKCL